MAKKSGTTKKPEVPDPNRSNDGESSKLNQKVNEVKGKNRGGRTGVSGEFTMHDDVT